MYRLYKVWLDGHHDGETPIGERSYQNLRMQEFPHLSLNKRRSDTCKTCDRFKKQLEECTNEERRGIEIQRDLHHTRAARGYQIPKQLVENDNPDTMVICLDLQQAFVLPKLTTGICYYKRKVSKCSNSFINVLFLKILTF